MENLTTTHIVEISISKGRKDASYFKKESKLRGRCGRKNSLQCH